MATTLASKGFPTTFSHPALGTSTIDATLVAIRWRRGVTTEQRDELLGRLGLTPVELDGPTRPAVTVNRTDGLWWVESAAGPVDGDVIGELTAGEHVEWAAPAYRAQTPAPAGSAAPLTPGSGVFTVNPTRLYVRRQIVEARGGVAAIAEGAAPTIDRQTRIPGMVAVRVAGRTAIDVAVEIIAAADPSVGATPAAGTSPVRLETVPFLSPATRVANCRPPATPFVPNDPLFGVAWGLARIEAPRGWQIQRGDSSVVIAVIDEGVELAHPDLDVHPQSWNASDDLPDGGPTGSHGTACAGVAAARLDNGVGVSGVAGGAQIMAIATSTWADVDIAESLYFAADHGAHVVSMSFGVYPEWGMWDFDLIRDALAYAQGQGLVLVAAAGNEDGGVARFPGSDARTICVGGSNRSDERKRIGDASAESWWGASWGPDLDVVAPCLEIPTTDRLGVDGYDAGDYTLGFNGTSAATPHVAGLAALIRSLRPGLDIAGVRRIIESTCDKISPNLYPYVNVPGKPHGTWHPEVGYGRINVERALLAACALDPEGGTGCSGCGGCGGNCAQETPSECRSPRPIPWLTGDRCLSFFEARTFSDRLDDRRSLQIRISYEHLLCLLGRQQGPLLFTTTLLPGESVTVYEFDRYRRVRQQSEQLSVHSSFRQTMSALSETSRFASSSAYLDTLTKARTNTDTSVSVGGGLAGFFGAPQASGEVSTSVETTIASGAAVRTASEQFTRNAVTAAQSTEAERSLVISAFEDSEHQQTTQRTLRNTNDCFAVTYFVRRVMEVYESSSRVDGVQWRLDGQPWRSIDDLDGAPDEVRRALKQRWREIPRPGELVRDPRRVTIPTDGALYEPELAHCSSCEPLAEARHQIDLELARVQARRACLETEMLALEVDRRRQLAAAGAAEPLDWWASIARRAIGLDAESGHS